MNLARFAALPLALATLSACGSEADTQDAPAEAVDAAAAAAAPAAAPADLPAAALGLTEAQLRDADLVTADGTELGEVEEVRLSGTGTVDGLLVEIEDSDPDRYVLVPLEGLTTRADGDDTDVQTSMTAQDLAALPDAAR